MVRHLCGFLIASLTYAAMNAIYALWVIREGLLEKYATGSQSDPVLKTELYRYFLPFLVAHPPAELACCQTSRELQAVAVGQLVCPLVDAPAATLYLHAIPPRNPICAPWSL